MKVGITLSLYGRYWVTCVTMAITTRSKVVNQNILLYVNNKASHKEVFAYFHGLGGIVNDLIE